MLNKQSEKKIEPFLVQETKKRRGLCLKMVTFHIKVLPDRLVLLPFGKLFFIETKSEGDKPRPIQAYMHNKLKALGFKVFVCDTKEKVTAFFKENYDGL